MEDSVIADIRVLPLVTDTASVSRYIAAVINVLKQAPDISYRITPMSTIVEGPLYRVMELMQEMHEIPFSLGVDRVITSISIDDRRDKHITMESKVRAVEEKLHLPSEPQLMEVSS
ncbi:MTH1187 family thiamine-binding protein [Chloroflexota bacterium]